MDSLVAVDPCSVGSLAKKATSLSIPIASLKFPAISALSYSTIRTKDWDDILTAHTDEAVARSWTMKDKRVGKHVFTVAGEKKKGSAIGSVKVRTFPPVGYRCVAESRHQAVCVTACGNFGIAASSTGIVNMYNIQSGILRRTFDVGPCPSNVPSRFRPTANGKRKEERCITGLASDALDRVLVASTLDGTINVCSH